MDPLSITSAVISMIQLTRTCLMLGNKHLGTSQQTPASLTALKQELHCFRGAINGLKTYIEVHEEEARLSTLSGLESLLRNCNDALYLLQDRLASSTFIGRCLRGSSLDKKLEEFLDILRNRRALFEIVLLADQRTVISATERYAINIAEDIRDFQANIDTSGQLMLDLSAQMERHTEQTGKQHVETSLAVQQLGNNLAQLRDEVARWNRSAEKQQVTGWLSAPNISSDYHAVRQKYPPGTGEWLTNGRDLWIGGPSRPRFSGFTPPAWQPKTKSKMVVFNYLIQIKTGHIQPSTQVRLLLLIYIMCVLCGIGTVCAAALRARGVCRCSR